MRIKCLYNTGKDLRIFEDEILPPDKLGKFNTTEFTQFGAVEIGEEYFVMGMLFGENKLEYLIDSGRVIVAYPIELFEVIDSKIPPNWHFKNYTKDDTNYPYIQAIFGYYELCFVDNHYEQLVEMDEEAHRTYFKRKAEIEKALNEVGDS